MKADRVVREERVHAVVRHQPHFLEAVVKIRGELPDPEIDEVLRAEWRDHVETGVLDFRVAAPVGPLRPGEFSEEAEVLTECPGREEVRLLRKLEDLVPVFVLARGVDVRHLRVQRERDVPGQIARVEHLRPHARVGVRTERDRLLFDLVRGLPGQVVAVQAESLAEGV